jgi:hypothetical protein
MLLTLQVGEVALLVKLCLLEAERMDDVVDLHLLVVKSFLALLGGRVGADV